MASARSFRAGSCSPIPRDPSCASVRTGGVSRSSRPSMACSISGSAPIDDIANARPFTRVTDRDLGPWLLVAARQPPRRLLPRAGRRRELASPSRRCRDRRNPRAHAGAGRAILRPADLASFPPRAADRPQRARQALLRHLPRRRRHRREHARCEPTIGFAGFFTDPHFQVRFALRHADDGSSEYLAAWRRRRMGAVHADRGGRRHDHARRSSSATTAASSTGSTRRGRDKAAVVAQDLTSGATRVLAEDARADIVEADARAHDSPSDRRAVDVHAHQRWQVIDPAYADDFAYLAQGVRRRSPLHQPVGRQASRWSPTTSATPRPVATPTTIAPTRRRACCSRMRPALENAPLVAMQPVSRALARWAAARLLPVAAARCGSGKPLPMVLLVHGGPWGRDVWGFNPTHQWLANRGYAVLSVNFRGSTGFGKAFVNAANLEWGGRMHDDLIDAVDWAIAQRHRRPEARGHLRRELRRLRRAGRRHLHAGKIRLRHRHLRHFQPDDLPGHDPALLEALADDLEGADGRLHHRSRPQVPRRALAAQPRRAHRAPAADRARAPTTCGSSRRSPSRSSRPCSSARSR